MSTGIANDFVMKIYEFISLAKHNRYPAVWDNGINVSIAENDGIVF
jgi:hypothetical protein